VGIDNERIPICACRRPELAGKDSAADGILQGDGAHLDGKRTRGERVIL
jgi:hypothetical protein